MNDTESLWILCSEALREQVSDAIWQAYLSGITPLSIKDSEIVLAYPTRSSGTGSSPGSSASSRTPSPAPSGVTSKFSSK